jgi:hypothetical protein
LHLDHRAAQRIADKEVGLAVVVVVVALILGRFTGVTPEVAGFDRLDVALVLGVLFVITDRQLRFGNSLARAAEVPSAERDRRNGELGVGRIEFLTPSA